jgi:hypothetical protein
MITAERDTMAIFADSREISDALRGMTDHALNSAQTYWLLEAADHIDDLYKDACDMQRALKRLRAELAEAGLDVKLA